MSRRTDTLAACAARMEAANLPLLARRTFCHHVEQVLGGESGELRRDQIAPVDRVVEASNLGEHSDGGRRALSRVVVLKLNGGLGTGMGLDRAKSLIRVRGELSFLDLIAVQMSSLRRDTGVEVPLMLMNSFRTEHDTLAALSRHHVEVGGLPLSFVQHKVPKLRASDLTPVSHASDADLEWCPPGHGDLYTALVTSGTLDALLDRGVDHAFVSNADNLGAVLEPGFLGFMIDSGIDFMMEVADRTPADRKGGHLCQLADGRLALREAAQCPDDERDDFQDIARYRHFNSNNLWLNLSALKRLLSRHRGVLPLATIVNRKTVDPREPTSTAVLQLETAMGAAISLFDRTAAVRIPRHRFSPVKSTNDLLGVRSDAYDLTADGRVVLHARRERPPTISLDRRFFTLIDEFERRFPYGPPSLRDCETLTVDGDATFGEGVVVTGCAHVRAGRPASIPSGSVVSGDLNL